MKNFILVMMVLISATACTPEKKSLAETALPPTDEEDSGFGDVDSPLYLQIGTRWESSSGSYELNDTCEVPKLAPVGTIKNCTFTVPEAKLYYSDLKFVVGTSMAASCPIVYFSPYYYRRSDDAAFKPAGQTTAIDCNPATATTDNPVCYGGAATKLIENFPENRGTYFNTNVLGQHSFDLPSENTTRWYGGNTVNYLVTNNITAPASVQAGNGPTARTGAWQDYSIECVNIWGEMQFQINYIIEDENWDPADPGADQFTDWP